MRSPAVILLNPKYSHNVAGAIRACSCFDIPTLLWTGLRVNPSEYERLPREERMKGYRDVEWKVSQRPLDEIENCTPVCIEITEGAVNIASFAHPDNAVYIFGPEDGGVIQIYRRLSHHFVFIPSRHCLNLSAALNVVLYDRMVKSINQGGCALDFIRETRGEIAQVGWDGK